MGGLVNQALCSDANCKGVWDTAKPIHTLTKVCVVLQPIHNNDGCKSTAAVATLGAMVFIKSLTCQ